MNMGFSSSVGNGGSSSSFSNLSHLAPPFTLDRSGTRPFSSPPVDMTQTSFGVGARVPLYSTLHNSLPSIPKTLDSDFLSSSTPEYDWLSFTTGSEFPRSQPMMEPCDYHGPLLGSLSMSSTDPSIFGDTSDGLTTSIGKEKSYHPSYASPSCNEGGPTDIVDQPTYDWPLNSRVVRFNVSSRTNLSHGSSGFERSVEEASHSTDLLDLNKCNEFVRECQSEELLLDQNLNIERAKNLRTSNMDAHSAFPGCHPKTRTPPSNLASSFQNCQYLQKAPYQEILREKDARLSVTTSIVNSPDTFSTRPPVLGSDSFVWNIGPRHISDNCYYSFEAKEGGDDISNLKKFLPVNSDSQDFFSTENHGTCIDKHDPIITEFSSIKIHDPQSNIQYAKDSPDHTLKAGMGLHVPVASPQFSLDLKTIETAARIESSSESFDQYNLAVVDSPCWKGAPISRFSPFQAFETSTPSRVKTVEINNGVNLSLSQVPPTSGEDTVEVFVHGPNESTIGSVLEKGATSSAKMPSIAGSFLPATQKTSDSVKAGEFYSKTCCFDPTTGCIHEPVEDGGDSYSSQPMLQSKYKNNLSFGEKIEPTSYMKEHADARLNSDDSSENGFDHLSCDVAKHVQNLPFEFVKVFLGESISKIDIRILVETLHSLSELLLVCHSNGLGALHQKDVKSLETVINNLDVCLNSVGSQGSLSPERRTSQNLEQFHQLHSDFQDVGMLKSRSHMTKIERENLECVPNDGKTDQFILSVKKDKEAADSLYLKNWIDLAKEDSMTKALKKAMSENFHDDEEHSQTLLYKNLWLEAEAALCASNLRARFNGAKSEIKKCESPEVREHAKERDEAVVSDASLGSNTIGKLASKTKVGSTSFVSFQTSPAVRVTSHESDDVITRFHILKCREDEARDRDVGNSGTPSDFEVSRKQDVAEKSALDKKQTAVPYIIKDMDSSFPTLNVKGNDSEPHLPSIPSPLTWSSHIDDVMSRFQILKSRGLNAGKVQKLTNSHHSEIDMLAHKCDTVHSPGISTIHHAVVDNKNEVDSTG